MIGGGFVSWSPRSRKLPTRRASSSRAEAVKRLGPMSINTLAAELAVDRTTLGRNIRPLERDDLIAIEPDPSDGRSKILRLTKAGDARFQRAQKHWAEAQKRFERAYGGRQASQLRESLRAVVASELGPFDSLAAE